MSRWIFTSHCSWYVYVRHLCAHVMSVMPSEKYCITWFNSKWGNTVTSDLNKVLVQFQILSASYQQKVSAKRHCLFNNFNMTKVFTTLLSRMNNRGWGYSSVSRVLALQAQGPEFDPQYPTHTQKNYELELVKT